MANNNNVHMVFILYFQFNPTVPISTEIPGFERNTTLKDRIHCVCFVIDGSTAGVLSEKILQCIKEIQRKIYLKGEAFLFHILP